MYLSDKPTPSPSPAPDHKVIPKKQKSVVQQTFSVVVKDNVVYTGKVITLEVLNNIFNKDFTNGILLVYLDGKLVFNGTTADDLTLVIFQILENITGQHEIKVVYTNSNNETNTYVENITIN